jgi:predicted phosphodiesterase
MKLAVIADIHGNAVALDAVLADLARDPADAMICLGDCVQGGAQPAEVVARLRQLACPVVMGNADAFLLTEPPPRTGSPPTPRGQQLLDVREWSLSRLSAADRDFIAAFSPTVAMDAGGRSLLGFHGSPASFDDILLPDTPREEFERLLAPHAADLMCGGHVHLQFQRRFGDSLHFNPGSVGQAYLHDQPDGVPIIDPWAEYAVVESDGARLALEFRRVPYDIDEWFRVMRASGRPHAEVAIAQFRARS